MNPGAPDPIVAPVKSTASRQSASAPELPATSRAEEADQTQPNAAITKLLAELADQLTRAIAEAALVEGLSAQHAARFVGVSVSKWYAMNAAGECPQAVELGASGCPRWLRSELLAWLRSNAPVRSKWRQMRDVVMRRTQ
jgi:predicted DNA-binding transcriptional regulator AlpA